MSICGVRDWQTPDKSGGLNGSTQHFLAVYSQESENLKFVVGVDLPRLSGPEVLEGATYSVCSLCLVALS